MSQHTIVSRKTPQIVSIVENKPILPYSRRLMEISKRIYKLRTYGFLDSEIERFLDESLWTQLTTEEYLDYKLYEFMINGSF